MGLSRRAFLITSLQALVGLAACAAPSPAGTPVGTPVDTPAPPPTIDSVCIRGLPTVAAPTPLPYPGYAQQELETGLHVTGPAQTVDLAGYRLRVTGLVRQPLSLTYDDLRCLPKVGAQVMLDCPGFFVDWSNLVGPTLSRVLALAGPQPDVETVTLTSVDGYKTHFSLAEAQAEENFLAYEWEGEPLPASHGFPLRAVLPAKPGNFWVKWLVEIELS